MFYSQSFLARKGPMGTVWCAAHMQSRLKKSHYTSTHIPSTVDRIMFPEVPLALRMSGHLLVGVVRIYAKQVDILYHDCNVALVCLRKAVMSTDLNLPEDARQAPVQTVTLPETFDLDAMDLDDNFNIDGGMDHHLKSQDDITIIDQIPCETETYVCITFDEDVMMDYQHSRDSFAQLDDQAVLPPTSGPENEDIPSPTNHIAEQETPHNGFNLFEDPGPRQIDDNSSDAIPEIEIMRDAGQPSSMQPHILSPNRGDDDISERRQTSDQAMSEKEAVSPIRENILPATEQSPVLQPASELQASVASLHESLPNISPVSFAIRSTPRVQEPEPAPIIPRPRQRKRKLQYDENPVLSNKHMKKGLKYTRDLVRERKFFPSSTFGIWKLNNKLRKEPKFHEPLSTGLCPDIHNMFDKLERLKEAHRSDDEVIIVRAPVPDPEIPQDYENTEPRTPRLDDVFQEIEILRDTSAGLDQQNTIPSPIVTPSAARNDFSSETFRSVSAPITELFTPSVCSAENTARDYTVLSEVPEVQSEKEDDLFFLEADSSSPKAASQGDRGVKSPTVRASSYDQDAYVSLSQGVDSLTTRTRALARYLRRQSLSTPSPGEPSERISLNKLLEGKTRKVCARMFFETLVLRSKDLVGTEQEEPYGEITLTLTPALSKAEL